MNVNYLIDIEKINRYYLGRILKNVFSSENYKLGKSFIQELHCSAKDIDRVVEDFFNDPYHGMEHSLNIWKRCVEITDYINTNSSSSDYDTAAKFLVSLKWACIFHDISLFFGVNQENHAKYSAMIVRDTFFTYLARNYLKEDIMSCVAEHSYINERISGEASTSLRTNPVVDLFRLACRTYSNSSKKIERYYALSKKNHIPFYDEKIILRDRVFKPDTKDAINNFILSFCVDDYSFFFTTSVFIFRQWSNNTDIKNAKNLVIDYCKKEKLSEADITNIRYILNAV